MFNYRVRVENVLSIADFFGMLTVKIKRRSSTVMSQFSLFARVVSTYEKHLLTLSCLSVCMDQIRSHWTDFCET